jgi:hypothetical protein
MGSSWLLRIDLLDFPTNLILLSSRPPGYASRSQVRLHVRGGVRDPRVEVSYAAMLIYLYSPIYFTQFDLTTSGGASLDL